MRHSSIAKHGRGPLQILSNLFGAFNLCHLNVHHTQPYADLQPKVSEHSQSIPWPVTAFYYDMGDMKTVRIVHQTVPATGLDTLAARIAEAEMNQRRALDRVQ